MNLKRLLSIPGIALLLIAGVGAWSLWHYSGVELMGAWLICLATLFYLLLKK